MPDAEKIRFGAFQTIHNCLKLKHDEQLCIVTDVETRHIAEMLKSEADKVTGRAKIFVMEDFGARPKDGVNPLKFPDAIREHLIRSTASIYAAGREKGELESFRVPMMTAVEEQKNIRHAHMVGINDLLMETGMNADYAEVQKLTSKLMKLVQGARRVRVMTKAGTDFEIELEPSWKWLNDDGHIVAEHWSNLPAGEIFTCCKNVNGVMVIDGVLGDHLCPKYGVIEKTPVTLKVENGRVRSIECENKDIVRDIEEYSKLDENANRIGELGIGTNTGLKFLTGVMLQDEKFPGVHVAMGHGYPKFTGSGWNSAAHMDLVIQMTTITIDGRIIMRDGIYAEF